MALRAAARGRRSKRQTWRSMRRFFAIWVRSQTPSFSIHCTGAMVEAVAVADRCADSTHVPPMLSGTTKASCLSFTA